MTVEELIELLKREDSDAVNTELTACGLKGRERKIALQRLEEVAMWANKAIAFEDADK